MSIAHRARLLVGTALLACAAPSAEAGPVGLRSGLRRPVRLVARPDMEIFVMNADGSGVQQITHNTLWDEGPAWSPDGTKLAFSRGADDLHLDIWTMNADGSDARQLTTYPGRDESPDWGPNPHPLSVGGTVAPTLELHLSADRTSFGSFLPGLAHDYTATATATITSTAGDATLAVADATGVAPGHLVNGTFSLP